MDPRPLSPDFAVAPQLSLRDVGAAARAGFRAIINNRPDHEGPDQPNSAEIEAAARAEGLDYRHIPVSGAQVDEAAVEALASALEEMSGPVLAFCRSGTRSAVLWALNEARRTPADALIEAAAKAGYDLSALRGPLAARRGSGPDAD